MKSPTRVSASPSKEKAESLLRAALSKKAQNPVLIRMDGITTLADYFLIVSGRSPRHATAVAEAVLMDGRKRKLPKYSEEGVREGTWALLDFGDVVVHVFHEPVRQFYDLEGLWAEAPREEFPPDLRQEIEEAQETAEDEDEWDEW